MVFRIVASDSPSRHRRGVTLFYKESPRFPVEAHQQHGPNVIMFYLITDGWHWHVVGCYLATRDAPTLESGIMRINHRPGGVELLVAGYFNTDFKTPDGNKRDKEITAETATDGLENRIEHFIPCKILCTWEGWTWSMFRSDQEVRSWTDYIL